MDKVQSIYYRGSLKSCNFSCAYCPFAKKTCTQKELTEDKAALSRFYEAIAEMENIRTIFIIPYGEAMIHPYYHEILAKISKLPQIKHVSIQSNLSWPVDKALQSFEALQADFSKLHFWLTYHIQPYVSVADFLQKCFMLHEHGLRFCVGSVAKYEDIEALAWLKKQLPANTYFWLNAIEGMNIQYSKEEIADFTGLDSLFPLEIKNIKADFSLCDGGKENIFVKANGDIYPCILSKQLLGNLYEDTKPAGVNAKPAGVNIGGKTCHCKLCSCYLAYSCRRDIAELNEFMGECKALRLPPLD